MHDKVDDEVGKKDQKIFKSKNLFKNLFKSKKIVKTDILIPRTSLTFTKLRQVFVKALILHYFDLKCHIQVQTDVSNYAISEIFSQLTANNLGQWHPVAFFSQKMILAKTRYETHNSELLAMVEAFKTWRH